MPAVTGEKGFRSHINTAKYQDGSKNDQLRDISKAQRKTLAPELTVFQLMYPNRDEAMARAY